MECLPLNRSITVLCDIAICVAPLTGGHSCSQCNRQAKETPSNYEETQVISPIASHSVMQEESHSRVQDPLEQRPGSRTEQYGTKVQDHRSDQQVAPDERSEQIAVWTYYTHRDISVLDPAWQLLEGPCV